MMCNCSGDRSHLLGFRFNPKEDELLFHFLLNRVTRNPSLLVAAGHPPLILDQPELQVDCDPYELPDELRVCDSGWYYFSRVSILGSDTPAKAMGKGKAPAESSKTTTDRLNRRTKCGSWKGTGGDTTIQCQWPSSLAASSSSDTEGLNRPGEEDGEEEGMKGWRKILVYYNEDKKKTDWVMYEYRLDEVMQQGTIVLRHVFNKSGRNAYQVNPKRRKREDSDATAVGMFPPSPISSTLLGGSKDCRRFEAMSLDDTGSDADAKAKAYAHAPAGTRGQKQESQEGILVQGYAPRALDFQQLNANGGTTEGTGGGGGGSGFSCTPSPSPSLSGIVARDGVRAGGGRQGMSPLEQRLQQVVEAKTEAVPQQPVAQRGRISLPLPLHSSAGTGGLMDDSREVVASVSFDRSSDASMLPHSSTSIGESFTDGAGAPPKGSTTPQFPPMPLPDDPPHFPGMDLGDTALDLAQLGDFGTDLDALLIPLPVAVSIRDGTTAADVTLGEQLHVPQQVQEQPLMVEGGGDFVPAGKEMDDYGHDLLSDMLMEQGGVEEVALIHTHAAVHPSIFDAHLPGGAPPASATGEVLSTGAEGHDEFIASQAGGFTSILQEALSGDVGTEGGLMAAVPGVGGDRLPSRGSSTMQGPVGVHGGIPATIAAPAPAAGAPSGHSKLAASQESSVGKKLAIAKERAEAEESTVPPLVRSDSMPDLRNTDDPEADEDMPDLAMAEDMLIDMIGEQVAQQAGDTKELSGGPGTGRPRGKSKFKFPTEPPVSTASANIQAPSRKKFDLKSVWQNLVGLLKMKKRS